MRQPLNATPDTAAHAARFCTELVSAGDDTDLGQPNRLEHKRAARWVYTEEQAAANPEASMPVWAAFRMVQDREYDAQNPLGWMYAARDGLK